MGGTRVTARSCSSLGCITSTIRQLVSNKVGCVAAEETVAWATLVDSTAGRQATATVFDSGVAEHWADHALRYG